MARGSTSTVLVQLTFSPLKMEDWKTFPFPFGITYFQGAMLVSGSVFQPTSIFEFWFTSRIFPPYHCQHHFFNDNHDQVAYTPILYDSGTVRRCPLIQSPAFLFGKASWQVLCQFQGGYLENTSVYRAQIFLCQNKMASKYMNIGGEK